MNTDLPAQVRAVRKERGWTQPQMAEAAGVSTRAYQDFEGRKHTPQPENLKAILAAAGIEPQESGDSPSRSSEAWPDDIQTFLDAVGVHLSTFAPGPERRREMKAVMELIFKRHHNP